MITLIQIVLKKVYIVSKQCPVLCPVTNTFDTFYDTDEALDSSPDSTENNNLASAPTV